AEKALGVGRGAPGDDPDIRPERSRQDHQLGGGPQAEPEGIDDDNLAVIGESGLGHRWLLEGDRQGLSDGAATVTEMCPPSWRSSPRMAIRRPDEGWFHQSMACLFKGSNHPQVLDLFLNWSTGAGYARDGQVEFLRRDSGRGARARL